MAKMQWDVIIVGQGLAGTTLALQLESIGQKVLIIDPEEGVTTSKIAAGLITPITGLRMTVSTEYENFLSVARTFYRDIENRAGSLFFHDRTAIRYFKSEKEKTRLKDPALNHWLLDPQPNPLMDPDLIIHDQGGFAMQSAQLHIPAYLEACKNLIATETGTLDWIHDVHFDEECVVVGDHKTRLIVSCEGFSVTRNPWFSDVAFEAAKGDILTVRFERELPPYALHKSLWIAPTKDQGIFRIGATYDREILDCTPSAEARMNLEERLRNFINSPYDVLNHQAAVRPIIRYSKPVIGRHPREQRLGFFNGLGSKGSLQAPWFAKALANHLVHEAPLPEGSDLQEIFNR